MDDEELRRQAKITLEDFLEKFKEYVESEATAARGDRYAPELRWFPKFGQVVKSG